MVNIIFNREKLHLGSTVLLVFKGFSIRGSCRAIGTPPLLFHSNGKGEIVGDLGLADNEDIKSRVANTVIPSNYPGKSRDRELLEQELFNRCYAKRNELGRPLEPSERQAIEEAIRSEGLRYEKAFKAETLVRSLIPEAEIQRYLTVMGLHDDRFMRLLKARNSFMVGYLSTEDALQLYPEPENYPWRARFSGQFPDKRTEVRFGENSYTFYTESMPVQQIPINGSGKINDTQGWFYAKGLQEIVIGAEDITQRLSDNGDHKLQDGPYPRFIESGLVKDL